MLRAHGAMERELSGLSRKYAKALESAARNVIEKHSPAMFSAAMGAVCFYDSKGYPIDDERLGKAALDVVQFGYDYTEAFGSPGIQIKRSQK
jgi:hypothetical protein